MRWVLFYFYFILSAPLQATATDLLLPRSTGNEAYSESFTLLGDLEDGGYILLQYLFTNAGLGDEKAGCRGLIIPPKGKGFNEGVHLDRDSWNYDAKTRALHVGDCELKQHPNALSFKVQTENFKANVTLHRQVQRQPLPRYPLKKGDDFFHVDILVPWAKLSGTVTSPVYQGPVKGHGYIDHTRANCLIKNIAKRWIRFRGLNPKHPYSFQFHFPPTGNNITGWHWESAAKGPVALTAPTLVGGDAQHEGALHFNHEKGLIQLKTVKILHRYRPVADYGLLGILAKPWIGDPTTTTYHAEVTLPDGTVIPGLFEVAHISD